MPDIIDFEAEKDRRIEREIERELEEKDARWKEIVSQLAAIMATSAGNTWMISAGLRAMLDVLEDNGMSRKVAKPFIAEVLSAFDE